MMILYPLFIVALFLSTVSAEVNWNIDCGTSAGITLDENFITWTGDDDTVISTGQPKSVPTSYLYSSSDPSSFVLNTLRAFPSGKKNCYVLNGGMSAKVQLRVMFYYGNYDGKSAPPTFGLQFDGNDWATVETTMAYIYYDVIYVTKGDNINVCLIQTSPNQVPFISAIQGSTLEPAMYDLTDSGNALFLVSRLTVSTTSIRFPTDYHDRIWTPMSLSASSQFTRLKYDGIFIEVSTSPEEPPEQVLKNALTTSNTSDETLKWNIPDLPSTSISVYLKLYFSEMTDLASTQTRAFSVNIGDNLKNSSLIPPYGSVAELTFTDITMSNATFISLVPTTDSTERPLINAMEVFRVSDYKVSYTSVQLSSSSPPDSSSDDTPPTSFSSGSGSSGRKKKSKLPVIFGAGIPVSVLVTAFLVVVGLMRQRRKKAAASNNGQNQNHMMNDAAESGQGVAMNEFTVNVEDSNNGDAYPSPAPFLFNLNN